MSLQNLIATALMAAIVLFFNCGEVYCQLNKTKVCICFEELGGDFDNPLIIENAGDGTGRLFVGEQRGIISIIYPNSNKKRQVFMNISDIVLMAYDERGFLGLAFHPRFKRNGRFFVMYSSKVIPTDPAINHVGVLSEFRVSKQNKNVAEKSSEKVIMEFPQPETNHNGGKLMFGEDGYLYIFLGDGGDGGALAQNTSSLLGKVLRINIDRKTKNRRYSIPRSNPFRSNSAFRPEIFAYGLRNPWRCGKDRSVPRKARGRGRIMCGDVGQNSYEEVDLIEKGGNYGWYAREGFECYQEELCGKIGPEILPVYAYPHKLGSSVIGGEFYRGCLNPRMRRFYVFGDFISGRIFRLLENRKKKTWDAKELSICRDKLCSSPLTNRFLSSITSFGEDENGELYMTAFGKPGRLYRIVDPRRSGNPSRCKATRAILRRKLFLQKSRDMGEKGTISRHAGQIEGTNSQVILKGEIERKRLK